MLLVRLFVLRRFLCELVVIADRGRQEAQAFALHLEEQINFHQVLVVLCCCITRDSAGQLALAVSNAEAGGNTSAGPPNPATGWCSYDPFGLRRVVEATHGQHPF